MSRADELLADEQNRKAIEAVSLGTDKEAGKNEPTAETDEAATASADSEKQRITDRHLQMNQHPRWRITA